jgi:hypothetical protein
MLGDSALFSGRAGAKGLAKGLGKGKLKGMPGQQLALEDEKKPAKTETQLITDALNKAKKMRDLAFGTAANVEDALTTAKGSKFWTKQAHRDAAGVLAEVQEVAESLKKFINKPILDEDLIKGKIMECGLVTKKGQNLVKEINGLCNKATSVAGPAKSKKK